MAKIFFAKYYMQSTDNYNYFSIPDPDYDDRLSVTKMFDIPRLRKQLTSQIDFSQLQYGDTEIILGLENDELSTSGVSIREFFGELHTLSNTFRTIKCICIIDSGRRRWAGFVKLPVDYDESFDEKGQSLKVIAYDAMVEFKAIAESKKPVNAPIMSTVPFRQYMTDYVFHVFFMYFSCNFVPYTRNESSSPEAVFNTRLYKMLLGADNPEFNIYTFIKGICKEWGLVFRFEVPENYDSYTERIPLTFRIMQRSEGTVFIPNAMDPYIRSQIPKIDAAYILLLNRRYILTANITPTHQTVKDIGHGVLIGETDTYLTDQYDKYLPGDEPENCFIFSLKDIDNGASIDDDDYKGKLTVQLDGVLTRIPLIDIYIMETDMFNIFTTSGTDDDYDYHTYKFGKYPSKWFEGSQANVVTENKITCSRLFCESYYNETPIGSLSQFMTDNTALLNVNRADDLRVLLKNNNVLKSKISLIDSEPDIFDLFIVNWKGDNETYSITGIEPDYDKMEADIEAIRLVN